MAKQKLEKLFKDSLKHFQYYYIKLQVNPLAHKTSPADFLVLTENFNYMIECKQVLNLDGKKTYTFDRLTQENDLREFQKTLTRNRSFVLICFLKDRIKNSDFYLIYLDKYIFYKNISEKKSLNNKDMEDLFKENKLEVLKGNILNIERFINK